MIAIPAVDLRGGACVQLVGGSYEHERIRRDRPVDVARDWWEMGFQRLHIVDLDAATERGENEALVREILAGTPALVQVGGGIRDTSAIEQLVDDGAAWVILGTRAVEDQDWLAEIATAYPGQLLVAADVRERRVVTHGWGRTTSTMILDLLEELNGLPLAGVLVTAVHREGQLSGTDLPLMEDAVETASHPIFAAGGIHTMQDLRALADRGVAAAVIGMALYTGTLHPRAVADEFAS